MLLIDEVSKISQVSLRMLRYYDKNVTIQYPLGKNYYNNLVKRSKDPGHFEEAKEILRSIVTVKNG